MKKNIYSQVIEELLSKKDSSGVDIKVDVQEARKRVLKMMNDAKLFEVPNFDAVRDEHVAFMAQRAKNSLEAWTKHLKKLKMST